MALITFPGQPDAPVTPFSNYFTGQIVESGSATVEPGFLLCDGSAVSRTTYSALFAKIGVTWGAGDTTTTFNVPDLRGRATIGSGTGSGLTARTLGQQAIGEEGHVLTVAELAAHNHVINISDPGHTHTTNAQFLTAGSTNQASGSNYNSPTATINTAFTGITATSNNNGSGTAHNTMQPSAVVTKLIKT
jgi:microcystin-dependent protein